MIRVLILSGGLVLEDLEKMFKGAGCESIAAESYDEALLVLRHDPIDLITLYGGSRSSGRAGASTGASRKTRTCRRCRCWSRGRPSQVL